MPDFLLYISVVKQVLNVFNTGLKFELVNPGCNNGG